MEITTFKKIEKKAIKKSKLDFSRLGLALLFMAMVLIYSFSHFGFSQNSLFLALGAVFGAYMAMNIGANDVANNVGPAVGSKALTLGGAILIAAIFEAAGALIGGGDVVKTIKNGIVDPTFFKDIQIFIWAMISALLAGALWLNVATYFEAPVSTTHSIVGGIMGGAIAAGGFGVVDWSQMGLIALSWIISPVMGGAVAALILYLIKKTIIFKDDKVVAAKIWIPVFVAIMAWSFVAYLCLKGLNQIVKISLLNASLIGFVFAVLTWFVLKIVFKKYEGILKNSREGVNSVFTIPLIFAAALLSFAHGANDVANAIGPLAAINDAVLSGMVSTKASIPVWVMVIGAIGISLGLALYGPKLIKTVGSEITELDQIRAYSIAVSAALTVIVASALGLPVSSTHIAIGGVFGVGFLREWLDSTNDQKKIIQGDKELKDEMARLLALKAALKELESIEEKSKEDYEKIVEVYRAIDEEEEQIKEAKKVLKGAEKSQYVKRNAINRIIAAWLITVPISAFLAAFIFYFMKGAFS